MAREKQVETSVEILEGDRAKITVTVDADTIKARVRNQYREFANRYTFPGFRKGKAPRPVIDSALGKQAVVATVTDDFWNGTAHKLDDVVFNIPESGYMDPWTFSSSDGRFEMEFRPVIDRALGKDAVAAVVTDDVVNDTCPLAIDESGLYPVGQADFDKDMDLVKDGEDFVYSFEIGIKPTAKLTKLDPIEIELPSEAVTDEEIDAEIDGLRAHYADAVDAADDVEAGYGKQVDLAIRATGDDGEELEALTTASTIYSFGSNYYPEAFEEQIIGMKKGDSKHFTIDMPLEPTIMTASVMGKTSTITFDVTVNVVKDRKLPELTDEWVSEKIGMDTVEELRSEIREEIEGQKSAYIPRLKENLVLSRLAARLEGEVPESMVDEASSSLMQDFFNQLQRQGMTLDAYLKQQDITSAQFREDIKRQATDIAAQDMALDAWAAAKGITATEDDVREEFVKSGVEDPDDRLAEWRKNGQLHLIRQGILRQKAVTDAIDTAIVTELPAAGKAEEALEAVAEAEAAPEEAPSKGKHAKAAEDE